MSKQTCRNCFHCSCKNNEWFCNFRKEFNVVEIDEIEEQSTGPTVYDIITPSDTEKFIFKRDNPNYEDITKKIYHLSFPQRWEKEGITKPNIHSKEETVNACFHLFDKYDLIPFRIVPTKEGGMTVLYENFSHNRSLVIEIYNDLDIAALVNDNNNKSIISSTDIRSFNFSGIVKDYFN